jgi:hypothetical protein
MKTKTKPFWAVAFILGWLTFKAVWIMVGV